MIVADREMVEMVSHSRAPVDVNVRHINILCLLARIVVQCVSGLVMLALQSTAANVCQTGSTHVQRTCSAWPVDKQRMNNT